MNLTKLRWNWLESHDQSALNPVVPTRSISKGMGYMATVSHSDRSPSTNYGWEFKMQLCKTMTYTIVIENSFHMDL